MLVKFTEFVKLDEQDICLYIMRESDDQGDLYFNVQIFGVENSEIILCKKISNIWKIMTQEVPQWIKDLEPSIISAIEQNYFDWE